MATLPKALINQADIKSAGGVAPHVRTHKLATMTYCCGILVHDGLVMLADTRTNAGFDNVSTFRKLHLFETPGERVLMLAAAGNLSVTQGVVNSITDGLEGPETGEVEQLTDTNSMLQAAHLVGRAVRRSRAMAGDAAEQASSVSFDVSLLLGGKIGDAPPRLFMIYTASNFIECTPDIPYLQCEVATRIDVNDAYFRDLRESWSKALKARPHGYSPTAL